MRECGSHDLIDGRLELHRLSEGPLDLLLLLLDFSLLSCETAHSQRLSDQVDCLLGIVVHRLLTLAF